MEQRERILKILNKKLNPSEKELFKLVSIENRKDGLTVRMPVGLISLEGVWEKIQVAGTELNINCVKAGEYATLDELDSLLGDIQWLWNGWIPKGFVTMVAGDPGVGKSAVVQHFVKIVTEGGTFPLTQEPLPYASNAVWIDTEASQQILKVRAGLMNINKKKVFLPVINGDLLSQANLGFEQDRQQIINLIEGVEPELLVLDSLGGSHAKGENKVEDIRPILEFLALLARDYQMAVIIVHHLNKGKDGESTEVSLYRLRGSTVIPAYCRSIMAVEKSHNGTNLLRMVKSNLALQGEPISIIPQISDSGDIAGFNYESYQPPPSKRNRKELCADWAYKLLKENDEGLPLASLIEQAQHAGFTRQNLYSARDILGDRITYGGTGSAAYWNITKNDNATINNIIGANGNGKVKKNAKPNKSNTKR